MAVSKAQTKATIKYKKKAWKRIPLDVPINEYEELKKYVDKNGLTVNGFIRKIIKNNIENA